MWDLSCSVAAAMGPPLKVSNQPISFNSSAICGASCAVSFLICILMESLYTFPWKPSHLDLFRATCMAKCKRPGSQGPSAERFEPRALAIGFVTPSAHKHLETLARPQPIDALCGHGILTPSHFFQSRYSVPMVANNNLLQHRWVDRFWCWKPV